jgi:hypothetical protein
MTLKSRTEHTYRKMVIYLRGYMSSLPIHFQNLTPNRLPNMILRKMDVLNW